MQKQEKKNEHWKAFSFEWFERHQKKLLWMLNTPVIGSIFRKIMLIPEKSKIHKITPCDFKYNLRYENDGTKKQTSHFVTRAQYAKRLYYCFKPVWWLMHYMDELFLDRFLPQYSWGFTTLTAYSDHDPETNTVDGLCLAAGTFDWADIVNHAGNVADDNDAFEEMLLRCSGTTNKWDRCSRIFLLFNTSSIDSGDQIDSAVLSVYQYSTITYELTTQSHGVTVVSSNPASNTALVAGDFDAVGETRLAQDISYGDFVQSEYTDWNFNAAGKSAIDKDGISKFALRDTDELDETEPTWGGGDKNSWWPKLQGVFADSSTGPKLVVEHSVPPEGDGRTGIGRLKSNF